MADKDQALEKLVEMIHELDYHYTPPLNSLEGEFARNSRALPQHKQFIDECWEAVSFLRGEE